MRTLLPTVFSVALLIAACSGGGSGSDSCTPGAQIPCACVGGGQGAQICQNDHTLGTCSCSDSPGPGSPDASDTDGGSPNPVSDPDGPVFLSFGTNVTSITVAESVTFSAILTGHGGADNLVGGSLTSADGSIQYGPFVTGAEKGAYSLVLTWDQINQAKAITFVTDESRPFVAQFFDSAGKKAAKSVSIQLTCKGKNACSGACVNLQNDMMHCGACDAQCPTGGIPSNYCRAGACFLGSDAPVACSSACSQYNLTCSASCTFTGATSAAAQVAYYQGGAPAAYSSTCTNVPSAGSGSATFDTEYCCCTK
jgi:hypothetical protein